MPFMPNLWTTTLIVLAFFFAYYVYEPPVPRSLSGPPAARRRTGARRGSSTCCAGSRSASALVGGGFLLKVWHAGAVRARRVRDDRGVRVPIDPVRATRTAATAASFEGVSRLLQAELAASSERRPRCGASCSRTPPGKGRSRRRGRSSSSTCIDGLHESKAISSAVLGAVAAGYVIARAARRAARRPVRARARDLLSRRSSTAAASSSPDSRPTWHNWYFALIVPRRRSRAAW